MTTKQKNYETEEKLVKRYVGEFSKWKEDLKRYWEQIDKNQEMYEFYKRENTETASAISLNTPFSIVESMVAKANEATLNVTVNAKGEMNLEEMERWISAILKDAIEDPDIAQFKGPFRKIKERFFREFLVKGNAVATIEWLYKTQTDGETKKPVADGVYCKLWDFKSYIFNPAQTFADSDVRYLESYVYYSDLKKLEKDPKTGKGLYSNLARLKELAEKENIEIDDTSEYSDNEKVKKKAAPIRILHRWEGVKLCVIANDKVIIREEIDPFKIGGHNIITAMNYVVGSRPYAYGEIDAIYNTVRAQDTIINQNVDLVNRYLRPAVVAKNTDIDQLAMIIEMGGVMEGDPSMVGEIKLTPPPAQAFTTIETLQQAIERTARYSPYSSGVPNQSTDKTSGTKGGIIALQNASEPNFQIKLDALQESFMQPYGRTALKMIANKMGKDDIRHGLIQGKSKEWVKANKAVLQGKPTMADLVSVGYVSEEDAFNYTHTEVETGIDPLTGEPITEMIPIPGADKALVFDVDWLVSIKLDNQSASDKEQEANNKFALIDKGITLGVQFSGERTLTKIGKELGWNDIEDAYLNEKEKAQIAAERQEAMRIQQEQAETEAQTEMMRAEADRTQQMQMTQMNNQAKLDQEMIRGQNAIRQTALPSR